MGKTQIGELFSGAIAASAVPVSRAPPAGDLGKQPPRLITTLIVLFLAVLGTGLFLQLMQSRAGTLPNRTGSVIYSQIVAQRIALDYLAAKADGRPDRTDDDGPADRDRPRQQPAGIPRFAVADTTGVVVAACRKRSSWYGREVTSILSPNFVIDADAAGGKMSPLVLASGEDAFVTFQGLGGFPAA